MSFSSKAKEELCRIQVKRPCCRVYALSAFLQMAGVLTLGGGGRRIRLITESHAVARWGVALAKRAYDADAEILVREHKRLGRNRSFAVVLSGGCIESMLVETGILVREEEGVSMGGGAPEPLFDRENECCRRAFLRGAFLGGASLVSPEHGYHLEFVTRTDAMAAGLLKLLNFYELGAKSVVRGGNNVVYLKDSDNIIKLLTLIGAHSTVLELENVRLYRDLRNNLNRQVNCESGNIQKTVNASARQIDNIRFLMEEGALDGLSYELRETAEARLRNPELPLTELGATLSSPIGKSGVNHRLRKLDELALELRTEKGDTKHGAQSSGN